MVSLLISPSRSLWGSAAELVGVVALDISLKELTSALIGTEAAPRRLYESGYAFVWDASGTGVVHKNYPAEHSAGGSAPGGGAEVGRRRGGGCGRFESVQFLSNFPRINISRSGKHQNSYSCTVELSGTELGTLPPLVLSRIVENPNSDFVTQ